MPAHHRAATAAGRDDVIMPLEDANETLHQLARFGVKAVVKEWLPAAGLILREADGAVETLEDFGDRHANARIELVGQAGDEEGDVVRHRRRDYGRYAS